MILLYDLLFIIVVDILFVSKCKCTDYCGVNICNGNKQHTLCKYGSEEPARHCIDFEKMIITDEDKKVVVDKINNRRNKVASAHIRSLPPATNMMKLEWDVELEKSAQRWANQCVKSSIPDLQDACRDLEGVSVGQNIATIFGDAPGLTAISLVDVWFMELLNMNSSVIAKYQPSFIGKHSHYDYFTQLIWAESKQVGCGGVKFKERYNDEVGVRNRIIYRLVCNFAPGGNRWNNSVYINGLPCSRCPANTTCDHIHGSLCRTEVLTAYKTKEEETKSIDTTLVLTTASIREVKSGHSETESLSNNYFTTNNDNLEEFAFTPFDFITENFTRQTIHETTTNSSKCKESLGVDDFVELLKKKLSNDPMFRELLLTKPESRNKEVAFTDPGVEAFASKIYSKKEAPTTTKAVHTDYINSTLLVDLVEAVIFKSGGHMLSEHPPEIETQLLPEVAPVRIQAELAETKQNYDFTGHYFFPEENEEPTTDTSESYYDLSSNLPVEDIVIEIEDIKKSSFTKDFLEEIIDDSVTETTSTLNLLSPDDMTLYKSGHSVMNKFLKDIEENSHTNINLNKANADNNEHQILNKQGSKIRFARKSIYTCEEDDRNCPVNYNVIKYSQLLKKIASDLGKLKLKERFSCARNCSNINIFKCFVITACIFIYM